MQDSFFKISNQLKSKIYFDYNIGQHTWFRTGGNAKIFVLVENSEELEIILNELGNNKFYILGSGSNLLIRDKGFDGIIIKLGKDFKNFNIIDTKLEVGASTLDINLSNYALKNNIEGFEFFSGIPGSVGGAIKMNAGCFGSETKDNLHSIEIFSSTFQKKILLKDKLELNYRSSNIQDNQIISKAIFNFNYGDPKAIKEKMLNIKSKRLYSQPIQNRTSGSTFKNPPHKYAAKLIDQAGCKGLTYGNAHVSNKHSNFLINNGNATAEDIECLGTMIIDKVYDKFEIRLEWEVKIIGDL